MPVASDFEENCLVHDLTFKDFLLMFYITLNNNGRSKTGTKETQRYRIE